MAVPASAATSPALPAFETLANMNTSTAKFATWIVRVISDPKIVSYTFSARGERVDAQKLECVLVSADPSDYMLGLVPFSFSDRTAAANARDKYLKNTVGNQGACLRDENQEGIHQHSCQTPLAPHSNYEDQGGGTDRDDQI